MNDLIHSTAVISLGAEIHPQVRIMPYSYIGEEVVIGEGCEIGPHCVIKGPTTIGKKKPYLSILQHR